MEFYLQCECGQELTVTEGAAGSNVDCSCGRLVSVPSLGKLRQLMPDEIETVDHARRRLTGGQRFMVFLGVLMFGTLFGEAMAIFLGGGELIVAGFLIAISGYVWLLVQIMGECPPDAVFHALHLPFFTWLFAYERWDIAKWALICNVTGLILFLAGFLVS